MKMLPLTLMLLGICILSFTNGYLELKSRNQSDKEGIETEFCNKDLELNKS